MRLALLPLAAFAGACSPAADAPEPWFVEDAARSGLTFEHRAYFERRHWLPENMGGGVALFDYDRDGDLDVYLVQSGDVEPGERPTPRDRLFANRGDGTFEDMSERARIGVPGYGMGCACGDFDGDGFEDLYVTRCGSNSLYRNRGDGSFEDVTERAGVADPGWSASAAWVDYDRDGFLDLYVTHYIEWNPAKEHACFSADGRRDYCGPHAYDAPERDSLFHNLGDGRFEDVSASSGIRAADGNGLGLACADFDGDGHVDVYVANDMNANQLWLGDGQGRFHDGALLRGCALSGGGFPEAGMGCVPFDVDQDGRLDLFVTHLRHQKNTLYVAGEGPRGEKSGHFEDSSGRFGFATASSHFTGFGAGFADFDHDGNVDLYVANGRIGLEPPYYDEARPYAEPDMVMTRRGERFEEVLPRGGTEPMLVENGRGLALGDLDGDGDVDVLVTNLHGRPNLLRNRAGKGGAWVMFDVRDERGALARGAIVELVAGGRTQYRLVEPAYSYLSSNDPRVHFGLGASERIDAVRVRWIDGSVSEFGGVARAALHVLRRKSP